MGVASALLFAYSIGLLYEGWICHGCASTLTFPFGDDAAAERAYADLPATASAAARSAAAWRIARSEPANPEGWSAVADADARAHNRLTAAGLQALDHAYAVSFFDRPTAVWRIGFAYDHWSQLTPELRKDARAEALAALTDPGLTDEAKARLKAVSDPAGRLQAAILVAEAEVG